MRTHFSRRNSSKGNMLRFCILSLLFFVAGDAVKLKPASRPTINSPPPSRRVSNVEKGGDNVCEYQESRPVTHTEGTWVTKTYTSSECCFKFLKCWNTCDIEKTYRTYETRSVVKMVTFPIYSCCDGWEVNPASGKCTEPICIPKCRNNGLCSKKHTCKCLAGFEGDYCQNDIDECADPKVSKCPQRCVNLPGSFQCICAQGFYPGPNRLKETCLSINECERGAKDAHGKVIKSPCQCGRPDVDCCKDTVGSYHCECPRGFRNAPYNENQCVDINECWVNPNICPDMSQCINTVGSYLCHCNPGFGPTCKGCNDCNKTTGRCSDSAQGCEHTCKPISGGGHICICNSGYELAPDRRSCNDIDECKLEPCESDASDCVNTLGSYYCRCKDGFIQNKTKGLCDDVDECKDHTASCEQKCTNTFGGYTCDCNEGFNLAPNGHQCLDINECEGRHFCTQRCENNVGSYLCACNPGYMLDANKWRCHPRLCEDIISPMYGQAVCDGYVVKKKCWFSCREGFEITGPSERVCKANGKWSGVPTVCKPKKCDVPMAPPNGIVTLPCDINFGSTCPVSCKEGFILRGTDMMKCRFVYSRLKWDTRNTRCEEILVCKPNPCQNKGKCSIVTDTEYFCNCTNTGHTGKDCEQLVVNISPIPKLTSKVKSPELTISANPISPVNIEIFPENSSIVYSSRKFDLTQSSPVHKYTIQSNLTGLQWVSYEPSSSAEKVAPIPDTLLFFGSQSPPTMKRFSLLGKKHHCYTVVATPNFCPSKVMKFSSTGWWENRPGNLVSTDGLIFVEINKLQFPVSLSYVSAVALFDDFRGSADFKIETESADPSCKPIQLKDEELDYTIRNDIFTKDFLSQYNKVTPDWFNLTLGSSLQNIHSNNIQAFVWSGDRVKAEPACSGAAVDRNSLFLVYLLHESLTMEVTGKTIVLNTKHEYCLLIDVCTHEPHLVLPPDNHGTLETVFSFAAVQSIGWSIGVKSVGFRKSTVGDDRKCSRSNGTQVAFGSANMTYSYKKVVHGEVQGDMFLNVIQKKGKEEIANSEQCFDGKSRFDTIAWYVTDYHHKRYTKHKPDHNVIRTKKSKPSPNHYILSVAEGKNAIFKMHSGLKPVLTASNSGINLNLMYKEKKGKLFTIGEGGDDGAGEEKEKEEGKEREGGNQEENKDALTTLDQLQIPIGELNDALDKIEIASEPFKKFKEDMQSWGEEVDNDVSDAEDNPKIVLSIVRKHYFKLVQVIIAIKPIVVELRKKGVDAKTIETVKNTIRSFERKETELKKFVSVQKPTNELEHMILNFMGRMCLYSPCMGNVNTTMYPMKYTLKHLKNFCYERGTDPNAMWQTEVVVTESQQKGRFFNFKEGDKLYFCLSRCGVKKGKINVAIKMLGTQINTTEYTMIDNVINISPKVIKIFDKYDFTVKSTVNLRLADWDRANIRSYGLAKDTSQFINILNKHLEEYALKESKKMNSRLDHAVKTRRELITKAADYLGMIAIEKGRVEQSDAALKNSTEKFRYLKSGFSERKKGYDKLRDKMDKLEAAVKDVCTIRRCSATCHQLPVCKLCQPTTVIEKKTTRCKDTYHVSSYRVSKKVKSICQVQVKSEKLKPSGSCTHPKVDAATAKAIIERLNKKVKDKKPLTEEDAHELQKIDAKKGGKLLEQIQEGDFFKHFARRLKSGLLTEEEFVRLEKYSNKTFANRMKVNMKKVKDAEFVQLIMQKINASQIITEDDYGKLRKINPQLEKKIRVSATIVDIATRLKQKGKVSDEDLKKLRKISPEYANNITKVLKGQEDVKEFMNVFGKKIANGTLSAADIKELERSHPKLAEKVRASLRDQLKHKVKEIHDQLKTVKSALGKGLNDTGHIDLQKQLDAITRSMKPFTKQTLKELQAKIKAAAAVSSGKIFDQVFERLELDYDIKNIAGSSQDRSRVLANFYGVLTKVDIPAILKRDYAGVLSGLTNIQEWFLTLNKIVAQACDKCGGQCDTDESLKIFLDGLKTNLGSFNKKLCKSKWTTGYKIKEIADICTKLDQIETFLGKKKTMKGNICKEIEVNIENRMKVIVVKWKDARKEVSSSNNQWQRSKSAGALLHSCVLFTTLVRKAYATELGDVKVPMSTRQEILSSTERLLKDKQTTASLAEMALLRVVLQEVISFVEKLPKFIKQNDQTEVSVTTDEASLIKESFDSIFDKIMPSLKNLCIDKSPNVNPYTSRIPKLVSRAGATLTAMLRSTNAKALFTMSDRFNRLAKFIPQTIDAVKGSMLPCQLREEKIESDVKIIEDASVKGLQEFLNSVKPLSIRTVKDVMKELDGLIEEYKDGIKCPVGKLVDSLLKYIGVSPKFNVAMMMSLTPKLSIVAFNTFHENIAYIENIFIDMNIFIERCANCTLEDVFGKRNLKDISKKLDMYFETISETVSDFISALTFAPRGLAPLKNSLEYVRIALQAVWRSETTTDVKEIINSFQKTLMAIKNIEGDKRDELYKALAGMSNNDIKVYKDVLEKLSESLIELHQKSNNKLEFLKPIYQNMKIRIGKLLMPSSDIDEMVSPIERRFDIVVDSASVLKEFGGLFATLYSMQLDSRLIKQIDTTFGPNISLSLTPLMKNSLKLLTDSRNMVQVIGHVLPEIKEEEITKIDLSRVIIAMTKSSKSQKLVLAKQLSADATKVSALLSDYSVKAKDASVEFIGGVSSTIDPVKNFKKKMQEFVKTYDKVEGTMKEIRKSPISEIGKIKDSVAELMQLLNEYNLNKLLSADSKVIPRKIKEMQSLFKSTSGALSTIAQTLKKRKSCKAGEVLGYNYLSTIAGELGSAFSKMVINLDRYADALGDNVRELQGIKRTTKAIKKRFDTIFQKQDFNADTLNQLSEALSRSTGDITEIQKATENVGRLLFNKDLNIEVIGGAINSIVAQLSNIVTKSHEATAKGERVYLQAKKMQSIFGELKSTPPKIGEGPLGLRIELAKRMANESKIFMKGVPILFQLSNTTLHSVGINRVWLKKFGSSVVRLTSSIGAVLSKTLSVLESADIHVHRAADIKGNMPEVAKAVKEMVEAPWESMVPTAWNASRTLEKIFNVVIDSSIKSRNALEASLNEDDLKSVVSTTAAKQRLAKFQELYNDVTKMAAGLRSGTISNIGVLTDAINTFVDSLSGYHFGKMLLQSPNTLRSRFVEFRQLSLSAGDIISEVGNITQQNREKSSSTITIFGKSFISQLVENLDAKFSEIGKVFSRISKRVREGFEGWGKVVRTATAISSRFHSIEKGRITKDTILEVSDALLKSEIDMKTISDKSEMIYRAIFNGDKDMTALLGNFEQLVQQVSGVLNKTSQILPTVGGVSRSVEKVKMKLHAIETNLSNVRSGPIESRISVINEMRGGINNLVQILPLVLNQSSTEVAKLGVDSSWVEHSAVIMVRLSVCVSNVVNKTNTITGDDGPGGKHGQEFRTMVEIIKKINKRLVSEPKKQKLPILYKAIKMMGDIFEKTEDISGGIQETHVDTRHGTHEELDLTGGITSVTHLVTGTLDKLREEVEKAILIRRNVTTVVDEMKSDPIQKIGKLTDSARDFVKSIRNYDIADILLLAPKIAKGKLRDLKEIVRYYGTMIKSLYRLVRTNCPTCEIPSIFRSGFVKEIADGVLLDLRKITHNALSVLDKIEEGATDVLDIIQSVKGINKEVSKLNYADFESHRFVAISAVLKKSSHYLEVVERNSFKVARMLFNDSAEMQNLTNSYHEYITQMRAFLSREGDYKDEVGIAFKELDDIQRRFNETRLHFDSVTRSPMQSRLDTVKNVAEGLYSIMSKFPELLELLKISPTWLKSLGTKLGIMTGGISKILNRTKSIAAGLGETVHDVGEMVHTGETISKEFRLLWETGTYSSLAATSYDGKIKIAETIVSNLKLLTVQVGSAVRNASDVFEQLTGTTIKKTNVFGDGTRELLDHLSTGVPTIAERYQKFQELSKTVQHAFDKIEDDPIKFATHELLTLFNQSAEFVTLLHGDITGIAMHIGEELDQFHIDKNIVTAGKSFYTFAKSALSTIGSGKTLITDFKSLLNSKNFKDGMGNLKVIMESGKDFIKGIDELGNYLFKNWDGIKGSFSKTLHGISQTTGVIIKRMGSYLRKGVGVGDQVLHASSSIKDLLKLKDFDAETVVRAASDCVKIAEAGVKMGKTVAIDVGTSSLGKMASAVGAVKVIVGMYEEIKTSTQWLKDVCGITHERVVVPKIKKATCYKTNFETLNITKRSQDCWPETMKTTKITGQGNICCPTRQCMTIQDPACLSSNEHCVHQKGEKIERMTNVTREDIMVHKNYVTARKKMEAQQISIMGDETNLKKDKRRLEAATARWQVNQWILEKTNMTLVILGKQKEKLDKIVGNNKCILRVFQVDFDVTSYEESVKLIPFRINVRDNNLHEFDLNVITNFDKEAESVHNIVQLIVTNYTDYIPMNMGGGGGGGGGGKQVTGEKSVAYWHAVCIHYGEVYGTMKQVVSILDTGIKGSSDEGNVDQPISDRHAPAASSRSEAMKQVMAAMKHYETATTENARDVVTRWKRTSQNIWSHHAVGSACASFDDCFHIQMDDLAVLLTPDMEDYDLALNSIANIKHHVTDLITAKDLNKRRAAEIVTGILAALTDLDRNAHFCARSPILVEEMPSSVFAYVEDVFELTCTVDGPAAMEYIWWKDNVTIPDQKSWKLELHEVDTDDSGYYYCEGKTLTSSVKSNRVLVSVYQPMKILTQPVDHVLDYPGGKEVMLHCNGTAEPEAEYRWWFKRYDYGKSVDASKPVVVARGSILTIKRATMKHTGQYWCELSHGYSSIYSRKAKLDIVRSLHLKESARLSMALTINANNVSCALPEGKDTPLVIAALNPMLRSRIGLTETDEIKLKYQGSRADESRAELTVDIGLKQAGETSKDSVTSAFYVSHGRTRLQSLLTNFVDVLKELPHGIQFPWRLCNISMLGTTTSIDWRADELVCPSGMGFSNDLVKCVQCSPGTYDNGKGFCVPCPIGTYQGKAGQTRCYPCGDGMLTVEHGTPAVGDCTEIEYTCDHAMSLVVVLDSSDVVSGTSWNKMKSFVTRLLKHMTLADDAVNPSIVVVGGDAKVEVSFGEFDNMTDLVTAIHHLNKIPGQYRADLALDYALHLSQSPNYLDQQHHVLFINQRTNEMDIDGDILTTKVKSMKSSGLSLFNILLNPTGDDVEPYISMVSQPVSRHFVNVRDTDELSKWPTVIARSLCTSTPVHK